MSNGKGSKPRKGANLEAFRQNYDEICWKKTANKTVNTIKTKNK